MGLGILRNSMFDKYVHEKTFNFEAGDAMLLFTDGVIEAKNEAGTEFGYERLKMVLKSNCNLSPSQIHEKIIEEVYNFIGKNVVIDDDYSMVVIKFQ